MQLVVLHGAPGVGKLTVARELASLTGFPLFHNHLAMEMLAPVFDYGTRAFRDLREEIWLSVFRRASQDRLEGLIFTLVFEPTLLPAFYRRVEMALGPDDTVRPFELRCEIEEHMRRVVQPERVQYGKTVNAAEMRAWMASGDYNTPSDVRGNVVLNITLLEPAASAFRIYQALQA